jgi:hypothetical protein
MERKLSQGKMILEIHFTRLFYRGKYFEDSIEISLEKSRELQFLRNA